MCSQRKALSRPVYRCPPAEGAAAQRADERRAAAAALAEITVHYSHVPVRWSQDGVADVSMKTGVLGRILTAVWFPFRCRIWRIRQVSSYELVCFQILIENRMATFTHYLLFSSIQSISENTELWIGELQQYGLISFAGQKQRSELDMCPVEGKTLLTVNFLKPAVIWDLQGSIDERIYTNTTFTLEQRRNSWLG